MTETANPLEPLVTRYIAENPAAMAQTFESMDDESVATILQALPLPIAVEAYRQLAESFAASVAQYLPEAFLQDLVSDFDAEKASRMFLELPTELRKPFLRALSPKKRKGLREFLNYPEESAGRLMTAQFTALVSTTRVKDVVRRIRSGKHDKTRYNYLYVVDRSKRLLGVLSVWDLLKAGEDTRLDQVMREVFSVDPFMDIETVSSELSTRRYFQLPVVDADQKLLGVIRAEHLLDDIQEMASEDIQKMFGAGGEEKAFSSIWFSLKNRLPWLHANLLTAFVAAAVVGMFEDIIAKITILAIYLPVVAGQGGNAGAQSLAVVMRGLVMREIPKDRIRALIFKEAIVGTINGVVIGIVTGGIAWAFHGTPILGLVIGLGMIVNLTAAGVAGAGIPLLMKTLGFDPAQSSNIILTTVTDVIGFFSFLGFASIFQQQLVGL